MIINMKAIYTSYNLFFSIHMFDTNTTSRTSTKDNEIQLRLSYSKSVMISINKFLILNSYFSIHIIRENVWKFNLKTIARIIMFQYSYILDVQIFSTRKLKISSLIWLIKRIRIIQGSPLLEN